LPELPEVETIVRELAPKIVGRTIQELKIFSTNVTSSNQKDIPAVVQGKTINNLTRRGKYICFSFKNNITLTLHLKMTGRLVFRPKNTDQKYIRAQILLDGETSLYFIDVRKFGRLQLWQVDKSLLPELGPEPLNTLAVWEVLKAIKSTRAIKTVLLDQKVLAGLGNIYADEVLFRARIHPLKPASDLSTPHRKKLSNLIPLILLEAIENQGTSISDYRTPDDKKGKNQFQLRVYGRAAMPCLKCHKSIQRIKVNGRSSHFCPKCQKMTPGSSK
jgi:formamidopyrimidine-DNA glycosylase